MPAESFSEKVARWAAILFLPAWAGVVGGELGPGGAGISIWDKALHFSAYFILSCLCTAALRKLPHMLLGMLSLIVMGGVLEIIQGLIGRDCSFWDEVANTLGTLSGAAAAVVLLAVGNALVGRRAEN